MAKNIEVISVTDIVKEAFGAKDWYLVENDKANAVVRDYIREKDAFYYARPREDFYIAEALRLAREAGKDVVVIDNLS